MKQVIIYSLPTCHFCRQAKDFLTEQGVDFIDYNVAEDEEKFNEMAEKSGQTGAPVIDIAGSIVVGFNPEMLTALLAEV